MRTGRRRTTDHEHRRLIAGALIAVLAVGLAVLAFTSTNGVPLQSSYSVATVLPVGAPTIAAGDAVRIAGLYEGTVASVNRANGGGQRVGMKLRVSPIGRDARLTVRLQSAAGQYYLSVSRGSYQARPLAAGGVIPTAQDSYTESLPTAIAGFGRATLGDLRSSLRLTGAGVYGRGLQLDSALDGVGETVRDSSVVLNAVSPGAALPELTSGGASVLGALRGAGPDDAGRLTTAAANLFGSLSARPSRLGETIDELPGFEGQALQTLPVLDPLLGRVSTLSGELTPAVGALRQALPSLTAALQSGPVLRDAVPPLVAAGTPALQTLTPVLRGIEPDSILLARDLPPVGTLASYIVRFPREVLNGFGTYYYATLYHAMVGSAPGYAAAAVQLVLTCVPGFNPHPSPGSVYTDRLAQPCD